MKVRHYIFSILLLLILCGGAYFLIPKYMDYRQAERRENELRQSLGQLKIRSAKLRNYIYSLQNNPDAVERIAREKFGWCEEDEQIYHFESPSKWSE